MRFERHLPVDVDTVWRAVSEPSQLRHWFMETEWEPRVGGRFAFKDGWGGTIGVWEPKRTIQFDADAGGVTRFELAPVEEESLFAIVDRLSPTQLVPQHVVEVSEEIACRQPGGPGTHWVGLAAGWHGFVDALEGLFGNGRELYSYATISIIYERLLHERYE